MLDQLLVVVVVNQLLVLSTQVLAHLLLLALLLLLVALLLSHLLLHHLLLVALLLPHLVPQQLQEQCLEDLQAIVGPSPALVSVAGLSMSLRWLPSGPIWPQGHAGLVAMGNPMKPLCSNCSWSPTHYCCHWLMQQVLAPQLQVLLPQLQMLLPQLQVFLQELRAACSANSRFGPWQ